MSPLKPNYKNEKMLTGTEATALSKKILFRLELDHRFGFTPFYGTGIFNSTAIKILLFPLFLRGHCMGNV